jgi:hypothetical protein
MENPHHTYKSSSSSREDVKSAMGLSFGKYKNADCFIFP